MEGGGALTISAAQAIERERRRQQGRVRRIGILSKFLDSRNSACTQSLNECGGAACSFTPSKIPAPPLAQHLNLTHNPRISGKPRAGF